MEFTDFGLKITDFWAQIFSKKVGFSCWRLQEKAIPLQAEIPKIFPAKGLPESRQRGNGLIINQMNLPIRKE